MANKQMHHLKVGDNIFEIVDSVARSGISGAPSIVSLSSAMIDTSKLYLYIGSETGYVSGNWYYHNGTSWVSGGQYGDMQLDTSLTTSGMAADAKSVGDKFNGFATTATAGQAPIADGAGGWAWGDVQGSGSGGQPTPVTLASDMTDTSKVYLYTGSESGYNAGHWYYYNGSAWIDGGEYGSGGSVTVDSALSTTSTNPVQNRVIKSALDGKVSTDDIQDAVTQNSTNPVTSRAVYDFVENHGAVMIHLIPSANNMVTVQEGFQSLYMRFSTGVKTYFIMPMSQTDVVVLTIDRVDGGTGKIYLSSVVANTLYEIELASLSASSMGGTVVTTNLGTATITTAGLMSATDKTNLDTLMSDYQSASTALG